MPEWRKDPVRNSWVVIAAERVKRPSDFVVGGEERRGLECSLCESHEQETPPEVLAYRERGSNSNMPGWWVRVIPNKFPAVRIEAGTEIKNHGLYQWMEGVGAHEVVVETPDHSRPLEDLSQMQVQEIIRAWRDRSLDLRQDKRFKYIQVFKNFGRAAGASLEHPHSQIIATPMVPEYISDALNSLACYAEETGRCIICEIVRQELEMRERLVVENGGFIAITPFASRFPYEVWIIPREHQPDYGYISEDQVEDLARLLGTVLKKQSAALGHPPFNLVLSTAPVNCELTRAKHFHWHIEILPRLTVAAGFELGTGCYINPTSPEIAAAGLRETVVVFDEVFGSSQAEVSKYV